MMRSNKLKVIALCIVMITGMLSLGVWTASAKTIDKVTGTMAEDLTYLVGLGYDYAWPEITTDSGAPAYIDWSSAYWEMEGLGFVDTEKFTPGVWKYAVPVFIDHTESSDVFDDHIKLEINGVEWELDYVDNDGEYSYACFICPKTFTVDTDGTLRYVRSYDWEIPYNVAGQDIEHIVTAQGVSGGKKAYKFKKESGPEWVNVSEDGTITGTPSGMGYNPNLVVSVTDDNGDKKQISIPVGFTDSTDRYPITYIEGDSNLDDVFKEGNTPGSVNVNITYPEDGEIISSEIAEGWVRYDSGTGYWEPMSDSETFNKDTAYRYRRKFEPANKTEYVIASMDLYIDGKEWKHVSTNLTEGFVIYESPDLWLEKEISTVTFTNVPYPVVDKPLPALDTAVLGESRFDLLDLFWCKIVGESLVPCSDTEYVKSDTQYFINAVVVANGGSTVSGSVTATVNGYGKPRTQVKDNDGFMCRVISEMPVLEECDSWFVVSAGALNVRDDPSMSGRRVGGLKYGDVVYGKGSTSGWVLIEYKGENAWVNRNYLLLTYSKETAIPPEKYIVTVGALNVRETPYNPGDDSNRIGGYKLDDEVIITGKLTDKDGNEWLVTEYPGKDGSVLGFMMAKYATSASAKIEKQSAFINIDGAYPYSAPVPYKSAISVGNDVDLTENDYADNGDGTYSTTFYPDDSYYFYEITPDDVTIPDSWELSVMGVTLGEDGSITVRIGPRNPVTVTFTDEDGQPAGSIVISAGGNVQQPGDPELEGYEFVGWFSDSDLTKEFDFNNPVKKDTTLYPGFVLKTIAPDLERDNPETGVLGTRLMLTIGAAAAALIINIRKKDE